MSRHRGEDIPSVEGGADGGTPVLFIGNFDGFRLAGVQGLSVVDGGATGIVLNDIAEDAIVRSDEISRGCPEDNGFSRGAYSGIDHHQVDGAMGKELADRAQDKSRLRNILRFDGMADIDESGIGIDAQDYPFHGGDIGIRQSEIGGQGNYGTHDIIPYGGSATHPE